MITVAWKCSSIFIALVVYAADVAQAVDFQHRFGESTVGEPAFVIGFNPADVEIRSRDGLRVTTGTDAKELDSCGVKTVFGVRGDGRVRLQFDIKTLRVPEDGWGSGVMLRIDFVDDDESGLTVAAHAEPDGRRVVMVDFTRHGQEEHQVEKWDFEQTFGKMLPDTLEVARQGRVITISASASAQRRQIVSRELDLELASADMYPLGVWVSTGGGIGELDVTLRSLEVQGASLPGDSVVPSAPRSIWTGILYGSLAAGSVAIWILIRRRAIAMSF